MTNVNRILRCGAGIVLITAIGGMACANVWMDERFENTPPLVQGNGNLATPIPFSTLDTYSHDALTSTVTGSPLTATGMQVSTKAFEGTKCYKLEAGQVLSVGTGYMNPTNGNFQVYQFAINVDPIPPMGNVAEFRWNFDMNSGAPPIADNSFFVKLESNGSAVQITGGEDVAHPTPVTGVLGTLTKTSSWAYISLIVQKDASPQSDSRPALAPASPYQQGCTFFNSSNTPALFIPLVGGSASTFASRDWSFHVTSGTIYVDDIYWDGALENDAANSDVRPLNTTGPNSASDWSLFH